MYANGSHRDKERQNGSRTPMILIVRTALKKKKDEKENNFYQNLLLTQSLKQN